MSTFRLKIISSSRIFYNGPCHCLIIPALDGEKAVLAHHEEMIIAVKSGEMRMKASEDGEWTGILPDCQQSGDAFGRFCGKTGGSGCQSCQRGSGAGAGADETKAKYSRVSYDAVSDCQSTGSLEGDREIRSLE